MIDIELIPYKISPDVLTENFISRMPATKYMSSQWKSLNSVNRERVLHAVQKQLKWTKVQIPGDISDEEFYRRVFELIHRTKQPHTYTHREAQYSRSEQKLLDRAEARAKKFKQLFELAHISTEEIYRTAGRSLGLHEVKTAADIGAGDGVISKVCCQALFPQLKTLDIYEPYVDELRLQRKFPFKVNFKKKEFTGEGKYDAIFLITALHHITNPVEVINDIYKALNPGGLLIIREHQPESINDKMMINLIDILWEVSFTKEKTVDEFKALNPAPYSSLKELKKQKVKWMNPPSAYFTAKELGDVLNGFEVLGQLKEENYNYTELMQYMVFRKAKKGDHPAVKQF